MLVALNPKKLEFEYEAVDPIRHILKNWARICASCDKSVMHQNLWIQQLQKLRYLGSIFKAIVTPFEWWLYRVQCVIINRLPIVVI